MAAPDLKFPRAAAAPGKALAVKPLRGPDKVAALLLAMGKPLATQLLKHFDEIELRQITRAASDLGPVSPQAIEGVIEEFAVQFSSGASLLGTAREVEQLLLGVLPPEQIADIMSDVLGSSNQTMWERLSSVSETVFASYLVKEHPQTAALILSKVSPTCAAKVMGHLPRSVRNALMRRMFSLKPVMEPAMRLVEGTLHEDLLLNLARKTGADAHARMADIINKMDREQMEDVLQSLSEERPKAAEILKGLLFTFEDIGKLTPKARMVLFDQISTERVVLALKGTDAEFRDLILSSLASRARRIVEAELANGEPAPQRDVIKARRTIADIALGMAERGEIELNATEDAEYYQ
ncbi:flagellar motor switch protein FliG [Propylenella binzhouense]|uniref:Flagellar motor switch protein FliG n=1 Tax=Propylenella binzhouense TaxID=2555902 RepID=A0A964WSN4_9HYPH|nr:flagellar motor switch protein FliG [Propylenella binzhouense]MYZ46985.1 flagellar motor switch protein FliG [Propylenella binzhouense]